MLAARLAAAGERHFRGAVGDGRRRVAGAIEKAVFSNGKRHSRHIF